MDQNLKPQPYVNKKLNFFVGLMVLLSTLGVYLMTHARSLSFWDSGEYITCSSVLGIPHPPGNPFYIILGRFFCIFNMGFTHAWMVSFMSALMGALAVLFTYLFTVKLITMFEKTQWIIIFGGIFAAFLTAFSYTFWMNSIEAEVYGGLSLIVNFSIWLILVWVEKSQDFSHQNILLFLIYTLFLGFCIHQTSLQIAPALLFIAVYPMLKNNFTNGSFWMKFIIWTILLLAVYFIFNTIGAATNIPVLEKFMVGIAFFIMLYIYLHKKVEIKFWLMAFALILIGFSPHIYLLIRSEYRPFINEGYPHNFQLFLDYILRRQYGDTSFAVRRADFFYQIDFHFLRYMGWQFMKTEVLVNWIKLPINALNVMVYFIVTFLGFGGLYYQLKKNKHSFAYFFSLLFMTTAAMIFIMNLSDAEVRDRDYFFVTAYNLWAVAMAFGAVALLNSVRKYKLVLVCVAVLLMAFPAFNMASQYKEHDRSYELISIDYGLNILNSMEENAIVFTNGDNDTFPLWYAQAVKDPNAHENVYPAKDVNPTEYTLKAIATAMAFKNKDCFGVRKDVTVANLSLLNTPWYIRQLRDKEGVEFNMPDEQIDNMSPVRFNDPTEIEITGVLPTDKFSITFPKEKGFLIKDQAALQIIKDNFGKRPIYFAVTVSDVIGFDMHLRNEGMVDRIVTTASGEQKDVARMRNNIEKVYSYRGIFDDKLFKDDNMLRLINNYGSGYMRLSSTYRDTGDFPKAIMYMQKAITFVENKSKFNLGLAQLYVEAGKKQEALALLGDVLKDNANNTQTLVQAAFLNMKLGNVKEGFKFIEKAIPLDPQNTDFAPLILQAAVQFNARKDGAALLEKLKQFQDPAEIQKYIDRVNDPLMSIPDSVKI